MEVEDRIRGEQKFHDRQAEQRAVFLRSRPDRLFVVEKLYLQHEPWIGPALAILGDLHGKRVLDFGCGHGMAAVVLARRGATVTAFDLSGGYLTEAKARCRANHVAVNLVQANGEWLPFADQTFDAIWGNAVLHHLDMQRVGPELRRVLKPDGRAVFCEPWGGNPLLNWARRQLPYQGKNRTPAERPLTSKDLAVLQKHFPCLSVTGFQLFSMVRRAFGNGTIIRGFEWLDGRLLCCLPALRHWCRYVVVDLRC